ncbi:MAG: hypothetical protein NC307_07835 [Roseburia sp.]|nr:hypothetical protein [Roseburia sp.]
MKNDQLLPFERNRYYSGKMLTSADFTAEQIYMNNKRRFLNNVLYGSGVICGLNVLNLDELSILVESGAAIDGAGREIVVAASVVKKLSTLEGYENLTGDRAILCLKYREEEVHPMYCAVKDAADSEYQYSRIDEGYELFLTDGEEEQLLGGQENFLKEECILENEDIRIVMKMPLFVPRGKEVKISVILYKKSDTEKEISFCGKVFLPVFLDEKGRHELEIDISGVGLKKGRQVIKDFWVRVEGTTVGETNLILKREHGKFMTGDEEVALEKDIHFKIVLENLSLEELSMGVFGKMNLEEKHAAGKKSVVKLAELSLLRTENSCLIGEIREAGIKEYIAAPADQRERNTYLSYFREAAYSMERESLAKEKDAEGEISRKADFPGNMAWGRVEIPLSSHMKKGDICYSQEIMHGLGKGNVYVDVGVEYLEDEPGFPHSMRNTVYGDMALFPKAEGMEFQTAVKVMNDKGSFQIAAKLLGEQKSIILQMSWAAIRFSSGKDNIEAGEEGSLVPKFSTVRLKTKERYFFEVEFKNMKPQPLSYELTEDGSGEIGSDGVYIAPAKEGVYEICIFCTNMPKISTYVYAIVSR